MATIETEGTQVYGWLRIGPGEYGSPDGRWRAEGSQVTGDDGWWLAERQQDGDPAYVESFDTLRDLKRWVAEQELRESEAQAFNDGLRYVVEHDQIETGRGTVYRLRLKDQRSAADAVAEIFVRDGSVTLEVALSPDLTPQPLSPDAADALSAMLASAAALAELDVEVA